MAGRLGLIAGGLTFVAINTALDSRVAQSAGGPHEVPTPSSEATENISGAEAEQTEGVQEAAATQQAGRAAVGFALLAAVTLDGVSENLALGFLYSRVGAASLCWWPSSARTSLSRLWAPSRCAAGDARLRLRSGSGL